MPVSDTDICEYEVDLGLIETAVRKAGLIAKAAFISDKPEIWNKSGNHPVTDADIAVNDYLAGILGEARPGYGWLSEETPDDHSRHTCRRTFVVDPIDGTQAFIDRSPNFAVSVAVIENGRSIAGALYNPLRDEMYTAIRDGGAKLNGRSISVRDSDRIEHIRMVGYPRKFRRLGWPDMDVSIVNSMAYRVALVASGAKHATVSFTPKSDWDLAAAELIVCEAGGVITNLTGQRFRYDQDSVSETGVICAGPKLHALLLDRVKPTVAAYRKSDNKIRDFGFMGTHMTDRTEKPVQLLHLVIGGELVDPSRTEFRDLTQIDFVGAFPNYADARDAWKSAAQRTVDNAHMRYFVLHAHELIDPDKDGFIG
ncbi:MAG: DUF4170 domain-containing protein [Hyphomonadaceae bacterium]|nr:DUF4170 domain-containing protein [Hyphomonadaceae bacterium]